MKRPAVRALAVTLGVFSALILWCEVSLSATNQRFSVFAIAIRNSMNPSARLVLGLMVISYMSYCSFFAVFRFRVANYYHLHNWKGTEAPSLVMSAAVMLRIVVRDIVCNSGYLVPSVFLQVNAMQVYHIVAKYCD